MQGLGGKRIVVAGGATGIGAATAKRLAAEGAKVVIGDINTAGLDKTVNAIAAAGGTVKGTRFDLGDEASCKALIETCVQTYGGIDGLANVGWVLGADGSGPYDLIETSPKLWRDHLDVSLLGYKRTIAAAIPHFVAQHDGAIVNVSSGAASMGEPTRVAYAVAKAGLHALTRHVASRWGRDNIRCNAVAPGMIATELLLKTLSREAQERLVSKVALGRPGKPEELAASLVFLLSEDAAWITGQVLSVNGGAQFRD